MPAALGSIQKSKPSPGHAHAKTAHIVALLTNTPLSCYEGYARRRNVHTEMSHPEICRQFGIGTARSRDTRTHVHRNTQQVGDRMRGEHTRRSAPEGARRDSLPCLVCFLCTEMSPTRSPESATHPASASRRNIPSIMYSHGSARRLTSPVAQGALGQAWRDSAAYTLDACYFGRRCATEFASRGPYEPTVAPDANARCKPVCF